MFIFHCIEDFDFGLEYICLTLLFSVPAKIQSLTGNLKVNETNAIYLRCDVSGYPAPTVTWRKDGGPEQSTGSNTFHKARSTRSDSGRYVCRAANSVGWAEKETFVTVHCR